MRYLKKDHHRSIKGLGREWIFFSGLIFLLSIFPQWLPAREVRVEEVPISLHNKAVTGFKVVLDRNVSTVSNQIRQHVAIFDGSDPFQYDKTIIFENIWYRAITAQRRITLYFVLRKVPGNMTEVVYIAMYDYRQSINSRDFPGLSLKLQADLARLVRRITGDILRSETLVFDDQTLSNLSPPDPRPVESALVEHFQEEEVENNGVLLRGDPFESPKREAEKLGEKNEAPKGNGSGNESEEIAQLKAKIRDLESQQRRLELELKRLRGDQAIVERKNEQLMLKLRDSKVLRDSIVVLNRRVEEMLSQYYIADDFSVSSETALEMQSMNRRLQLLDRRWRREKLRNDSLSQEIQDLNGMLSTAGSGARERARQVRDLQQENRELMAQLKATGSAGEDAGSLDSLQGIIQQQERRQGVLERKITDLESDKRSSKASYEDLLRVKDRLAADLERVKRENQQMRTEMAAQSLPASTGKANPLRDSLQLLASRLQRLDDLEAKSARQENRLREQETEIRKQTQSINSLRSKLKTTETALATAEGRALDLNAKLQTTRQRVTESETRIQELESAESLRSREKRKLSGELAAARSDLTAIRAERDVLEDSLQGARELERSLRQNLSAQSAELARRADTLLDLRNDLDQSMATRRELEMQVEVLTYTVDSLERYSIPSDDQGQFIREQWTKLQNWENELKDRDRSVADKEKLMAQRESFLADKEKDIEVRETRLAGIEEREKRLEVLEQQKGKTTPPDVGKVSVRLSRVIEFGNSVPVFEAQTSLSSDVTQGRTIAWFNSRGEKYDQRFPDLLFEGAYLAELGTTPWNIRVRIDGQPNGSTIQVSFQAEDGTYLGGDWSRQDQEAAEQLIESMLRYDY